ncbi:glycosyltransferase family 4 protein [Candidatus Spongiihabitans sp.]|uniref:glycosyltransferase family 4 protein n=1 Tax=Candidatus Spongiihabitans sp. TaxID=3101308 RepID=UPI003C7017AF
MKKIACILKGYPRLSETFIAQEIHALENAGVDIVIYSLRHPTDAEVHPIHKKIRAKVHYLPEYLYRHPIRVMSAFIYALFDLRFYKVVCLFLKDLARDFSPNRGRRFGQALVLAREIDPDREWLYVHFLHTPASVARYASHLMDMPWSCSAHAKDIWTSPQWEIKEKLSELQWLVTCTKSNADYLRAVSKSSGKVSLLYHGLDLTRFPEPKLDGNANADSRNSDDKNNIVQLISVGRAVNKKGYDVLLKALSDLPKTLCWNFIHIGGGPLLERLKQQATALEIDHKINWLGAKSFEQVIVQYQQSDVFILASRIDADGDRDGLPNVLMEAMSQALPCIGTNISGIPEIIEDQINGILVPAEDANSLSRAIIRLIQSPELRRKFGEQGYQTVCNHFALEKNIGRLVERLK